MSKYKLLSFDLDDTLSESKTLMDDEMCEILTKILETKKIAIISGGDLPQIQKQVVNKLIENKANIDNFLILPTCGTKFFHYENGELIKDYSDDLTKDQKKMIFMRLEKAIRDLGLRPEKVYGEQIEDRGTQITFSAIGQDCPLEVKKDWDPDKKRRQLIKEEIKNDLSDFEIAIAGKSSIDITKKGIDKAIGMEKLIEYTGLLKSEIVFFGDNMQEGGNDFPVKRTGVDCIAVQGPEDTKKKLKELEV